MGEEDVDTYDRCEGFCNCDEDGDQWTQKELDEMRDIEKMHKSGDVYKTYENVCPEQHSRNYTKGEKTGLKLGSENQPNFRCECGNMSYEEPNHISGEVNGETRVPYTEYENHQHYDRSLHSDAFWLINEYITKFSNNKTVSEKEIDLVRTIQKRNWTLSANEVLAICSLIKGRKFTKTEKEVLKKGDMPKVMDMEINLDDWFLDDIQKFTKRAIKSCLALEEASFLGTNKMDSLILDICNKVFQELYKEVKLKQND